MKPTCLLFGAVLLIGGSIPALAAVKESDFPPRTVRDLIEICSPDQNDPMMTAGINFCHGFAERRVIRPEADASPRPPPQ